MQGKRLEIPMPLPEDIIRLCQEIPNVIDKLRIYALERESLELSKQLAQANGNVTHADIPDPVEANL
jgi:hypothetical protein